MGNNKDGKNIILFTSLEMFQGESLTFSIVQEWNTSFLKFRDEK